MKKKTKIMLIAAALLTSALSAYAGNVGNVVNIEAVYNDISLMINGSKITPADANGEIVEPFIYNGTTYLPVRAVSEALNKDVDWNAESNTVSISDKKTDSSEFKNEKKTGYVFEKGELIYENPLASENDVKDFVMEGDASVTFPNGKMRLENNLDPSLGQVSNYVYWCNQKLPDNVIIEWEFKPLSDDGLAIMFFSANGQNEKDLFDPSLAKRDGQYKLYHSGDINAFHVSYYRHSTEDESGFRVCNLRKSAGFNMVAQGADPLPPANAVRDVYKIRVIKDNEIVQFFIEDPKTGISIMPFEFIDDGSSYGDLLKGGYIGFRQKAPLIGEYSNLKVYKAVRK